MNRLLSDIVTRISAVRSSPAVEVTLQGADVKLGKLSTDTRSLQPGDTFIALRGPNHDGHDHLEAAASAGANALIVEHAIDIDLPQLLVSDTRLALGRLAWLCCRDSDALKLAVTGSNGKTTVKEMLASILRSGRAESGRVLATSGNFNNDIGLPLTCLGLQPGHEFAVLEMGTSGMGEIAYLSRLVEPEVAVVTSIAAAHLEGFGSIENIAIEKASIFTGLGPDGVAVFDIDSDHAMQLRHAARHCKVRTFGFSNDADVVGEWRQGVFTIRFADFLGSDNSAGSLAGNVITPTLKLPGRHNCLNALAAVAAASCVSASASDIERGLSSMPFVAGRLQPIETPFAATVIDDSYNANPASVRAAIDFLAELGGLRTLILGDMLELGENELEMHGDIGRYAKSRGLDSVMTFGSLAAHAASEFGANAASFSDKKQLASCLASRFGKEHTLLFKGSRGARMEDVIELLLEQHKAQSNSKSAGRGAGQRSGGHQQRLAAI